MLEAQIRKAETALCLLLNRQPDTIARASWEEVKGIVMDTDRTFPLEALASRPDVLAAECLLRASFSNVKVARAEVLPHPKHQRGCRMDQQRRDHQSLPDTTQCHLLADAALVRPRATESQPESGTVATGAGADCLREGLARGRW